MIRRLIEGYLAGQPHHSPAEVYDEVTGGRAPASDREPVSRDHSRFLKAKLCAYRDRSARSRSYNLRSSALRCSGTRSVRRT